MLVSFAVLFSLGLVGLLAFRLLTQGAQCDVSRIELFLSGHVIADHYRPIERLLQKTDWQYLAAQPGMTTSRIREFRAQRRKIFRQYLSSLIADFGALSFLIKGLMVQSSVDRSDLARSLSKARNAFYWAVATTQFNLFLHAIGFSSKSIEVGSLTRALEAMSARARMLQLSSQPSLG